MQAHVVCLGQWSVLREGINYLHRNEDASRRLEPMLVLDWAPNNLLSVPLAYSAHA